MISGLARTAPGPITLSAAATASISALAADVDERLGLQVPARRTVARLVGGASGQTVDEVTDLDPVGKPVAISRFDTSGHLVSSVRLGYAPTIGVALSAPAAIARAKMVLASVGIPAGGSPAASSRATGGWLVRWMRLVGSVPVPGDGVSVQLAVDGSFHGLVRSDHPLAPAATATIDQARVRNLVAARLDGWLSANLRDQASVSTMGLAWVAPNDTFGDPLPAGPEGTLRLAWLVRITTTGTLADQVAGLELAFDAGDGTPLGGDILE
jgi:hypothetical protein